MKSGWKMRDGWMLGFLGFLGFNYFVSRNWLALFFFLFFAWFVPVRK